LIDYVGVVNRVGLTIIGVFIMKGLATRSYMIGQISYLEYFNIIYYL